LTIDPGSELFYCSRGPTPVARLDSLRSLAAAAGALSHTVNCVAPTALPVQKNGPLVTAAREEIIPAVTYSPTQLPMQYHRR
jgi:hypothetical protein